MSGSGLSVPRSGSESTNAGLGPLAKSTAGVELWLRAQLEAEPWNNVTGCIPMPWKAEEARRVHKPQTIGVIWDDGVVQPAPPVKVNDIPADSAQFGNANS